MTNKPAKTLAADSAAQSDSASRSNSAALPAMNRLLQHRMSPLLLTLAGGLLVWLALPPLGWWPLAWVAAVPWAMLVAAPPTNTTQRDKRNWCLQIWLGGFLFWLGTMYFLPLPHPALWLAWPLLAGYLALWHLWALSAARVLVHQFRWPLIAALPVAWTTAEWLRGWLLTGFAMALVGHSQYRQIIVIQIADLGGAYLVSFVVLMFGTALVSMTQATRPVRRWGSLVAAVAIVAGVVGYGQFRLTNLPDRDDELLVKAVIVQGSIDTEFPDSIEAARDFWQKQWDEYLQLTRQALEEFPDTQLLIWPETALLQPDFVPEADETKLSAEEQEQLLQMRSDLAAAWRLVTAPAPTGQPVPLLTGVHSIQMAADKQYNGAALIDEPGQIADRYFKNHRVLFGEYIPLADRFTWLDRISPIGKSLSAGTRAEVIEFGGLNFLPNICFESTVPHLIRRHVREVQRTGRGPDILLNLTNDGWFFGTSCLDLHLACNVFRAVEMRCPVWVAANTGLSAEIEANGLIRQLGPRRQTGLLAVNGAKSDYGSVYLQIGDSPWWVLTIVVLGLWFLVKSGRWAGKAGGLSPSHI